MTQLTKKQRVVLKVLKAAKESGIDEMTSREIADVLRDVNWPLSPSQIASTLMHLPRKPRHPLVTRGTFYDPEPRVIRGEVYWQKAALWCLTPRGERVMEPT